MKTVIKHKFEKKNYNVQFLRAIRFHADMLTKISNHIPEDSRVIDLGCGPGLLAERIINIAGSYEGYDISDGFIDQCQKMFSIQPHFSFDLADVNKIELDDNSCDALILVNMLHLTTIDPISVLNKAYNAIDDGGVVVVSGPKSQKSFDDSENLIIQHLKDDCLYDKFKDQLNLMKESNKKILNKNANYWSVEGMAELLSSVGFSKIKAMDNGLYNDYLYLIIAEK